jgi:hypothetical protein
MIDRRYPAIVCAVLFLEQSEIQAMQIWLSKQAAVSLK